VTGFEQMICCDYEVATREGDPSQSHVRIMDRVAFTPPLTVPHVLKQFYCELLRRVQLTRVHSQLADIDEPVAARGGVRSGIESRKSSDVVLVGPRPFTTASIAGSQEPSAQSE
jgi:hypothetical protein